MRVGTWFGVAILSVALGSIGCGGGETPTPSPVATPTAAHPSPTAPGSTPTAEPAPVYDGGELPAPGNGLQLTKTGFEAPPYTEVQFCEYKTVTLDGAVAAITEVQTSQTAGSHHLILYMAAYEEGETPWADGIYPCDNGTDPGQAHRLPIFITSLQQDDLILPKAGQIEISPDKDVAILMPGGTLQLVVEQHVINPTDKTMYNRAAINLIFGESRRVDTYTPASVYIWGPTDFEIPPSQTFRVEDTINIDEPWFDNDGDGINETWGRLDVLYNFGHTHRLGTRYTLELRPAGSEAWEMLVEDLNWAEPTPLKYTPNDTLVVGPGAGIRMSCEWYNPGSAPVYYPDEMCFSIGYAILSPVL